MPIDVTENLIRIRQVEPSLFEEDSFRTIRLTSGVKAIIGRKKGEKTTTIQSILFDKKRFTTDQAKQWVKKHKGNVPKALDMEKNKENIFSENTKQGEDKMEKLEMSTFTEEDAINKLKNVMNKIMTSENLDDAKAFASELQSLIPKTTEIEEEKTDDENGKEKEEKEEQKEEGKEVKEEKTKEKEEVKTELKDVSEIFELNDKLISSLKEANTQIEALEKINTQLKVDLDISNKAIITFHSKEKEKEVEQFQDKLNQVATNWINTFDISSDKEQESVREMLSKFNSEDKLEEINRYLCLKSEKQVQRKKIEPIVMTTPSNYLKDTILKSEDNNKEYEKMNSREKTDYLYSLIEKQLN